MSSSPKFRHSIQSSRRKMMVMASQARTPVLWILPLLLSTLLCFPLSSSAQTRQTGISFFGFSGADLVSSSAIARLGPKGSISFSNNTLQILTPNSRRRGRMSTGYSPGVVYVQPQKFLDPQTARVASFSTKFSFSITHNGKQSARNTSSTIAAAAPLAFVITHNFSRANGIPLNGTYAVQFDQDNSTASDNPDVVHVGITPSLGVVLTSWIHYDSFHKRLQVWVSYGESEADLRPLMPTMTIDNKLFNFSNDSMFVGLADGRAQPRAQSRDRFRILHNLYGWGMLISPEYGGDSLLMDFSPAPSPAPAPGADSIPSGVSVTSGSSPKSGQRSSENSTKDCSKISCNGVVGVVGLAVGGVAVVILIAAIAVGCCLYRKGLIRVGPRPSKKDIFPDSFDCGQKIFTYKELQTATRGFSPDHVLGAGGSGSVYRGILEDSDSTPVAVKVISGQSIQGKKEFMSELTTISMVRHRNLVPLRGWCQAQSGELLLVYDYMPHGSLDQLLFGDGKYQSDLDWDTRFQILLGVASALSYLHEESEQQILHRDVKASNIMLDANYNARLGDFGVAKLVEHNQKNVASTTMMVGTVGYMAPETAWTRKATDKTDVYSFGALILETVCGRRPVDSDYPADEIVLLDWVWKLNKEYRLLDAVDSSLKDESNTNQICSVLQVGLLCSLPDPEARPSMRQAIQMLKGDVRIPILPRSKPKSFHYASEPPMSITDILEDDGVPS